MTSALRRAVLGGSLAYVLLAILIVPPAATQGFLSALETDVQKIANTARPSVVTVFAERTVEHRNSRTGQRTSRRHTRVGSGVAVEPDLLITTSSVVYGAEKVWIRTTNDLQAEAKVVGADPIFNVAVLRVASVRLPTLKFVTRPTPLTGEWVMAIGTSHFNTRVMESVGTVAHRYDSPRLSLIQLTNTVYPGYSGGAVLNAHGELVGIIQGEVMPSDASAGGPGGLGSVVLPAESVRPAYLTLRDEGRVLHGYLGVSTHAASVESDTEPGLEIPVGALIESVKPGGPADRAGLKRGDLLVGFERERVEYPEQLARWVAASKPQSAVELVWVRDEIQHVGRALLGESPVAFPEWALAGGATGGSGGSSARIPALQRQIQKLNRELERIRTSAERDSP